MKRVVQSTLGATCFAILAAGPCFAAGISVDVPLQHVVLSGCLGGTGQLDLGSADSRGSLGLQVKRRQASSSASGAIRTHASATVGVLGRSLKL